jgi:hypothetical protein
MSYIKEFIDDVTINPSKAKIVIKWILYLSFAGIAGAFTLGIMKSDRINKINNIEKQVIATQSTINAIDKKINNLNTKVDSGFKDVKLELAKSYINTATLLNTYQGFVQGELELLIDYGRENKGLLKSALALKQQDNQRIINQTVKSAIDGLNKTPDDGSFSSAINVKKTGDDYGVIINTMTNASVRQMDSISSNFKILSVELQDNGKYKIIYKIK